MEGAQDVGGFEMFDGRSRMGPPNIAVLMVRMPNVFGFRRPQAFASPQCELRNQRNTGNFVFVARCLLPSAVSGYGSSKHAATTKRFCIQLHLGDNVKDAEDDE